MNADDLLRKVLETPNTVWFEADWAVLNEEIRAYLDAPKDEPVAWAVKMFPRGMYVIGLSEDEDAMAKLEEFLPEHRIPLYLHPPTKTAPMKPMTVEEMKEAWGQPGHLSTAVLIAYTRAIERHHGIGGDE